MITDDEIRTLRERAAARGDTITVGCCDNALRYRGGRLGERYRRLCAEALPAYVGR